MKKLYICLATILGILFADSSMAKGVTLSNTSLAKVFYNIRFEPANAALGTKSCDVMVGTVSLASKKEINWDAKCTISSATFCFAVPLAPNTSFEPNAGCSLDYPNAIPEDNNYVTAFNSHKAHSRPKVTFIGSALGMTAVVSSQKR